VEGKGRKEEKGKYVKESDGLSWIDLPSEYNTWWNTSTLGSWVVVLIVAFWIKSN
jgi:hypothetical protein